jgi:simple sugar transport system permease protein
MMIDLVVTLATIVFALALAFLVLVFTGKDPIAAYNALLTAPLTRLNRFGNFLEEATTLILLGLAISIPFRARQFSLGAEGQIYIGALVAAMVAIYVPMPPVLGLLVPIACAMAAGFLLGLLPGWMKAYLSANEIVSTLMINAIIVRFYDFFLTNIVALPGQGYIRSEDIPDNSLFPRLSDLLGVSLSRFNLAFVLVILMVIVVWLLIQRTTLGYEIRMVGSNEKFARYGGINTKRTIMLSFALGGAVAALSGVHLAMGIQGKLISGLSAGLGFEGIVVALLARNNPLLVPLTGLFYAYLRVGGSSMETQSSVGSELVLIIQAIIILLVTAQVLVDFIKRRRAAAETNASA